jgi:hypothetical protein
MKIERIYHSYDKWEDHKAGFYDNISGKDKDRMIKKVIELFTNPEETRKYMIRVVKEWIFSCQHNLTNESMNKIAYLGQGACCLYAGIPSTVTMEAWSKVPEEFRNIADSIAIDVLELWEFRHIETLKLISQDNKC